MAKDSGGKKRWWNRWWFRLVRLQLLLGIVCLGIGCCMLQVTSSCIPRTFDIVHLSDHRNYWPFGYDSVMIGDTAFYRNKNYHTSGDTWDTLDYTRMAQVVTQVHQAVLAVARKQ